MTQNELERCEDLWFEDGNVVLQAETMQFQVYRGILATKSEVFKDMFSLPQPPSNKRPVVQLQDSSTETRHFLKTLFDAGWYERNFKNDFNIVANVLRLCTKYDVQHYRRYIISQLVLAYPTTLSGWDQREILCRHCQLSNFLERAVTVVTLARETDVRALIPAAMYSCCQNQMGIILDGMLGDNNLPIVLSGSDCRSCLLGRQKVVAAFREAFFPPSRFSTRDGCQIDGCAADKFAWLHNKDVWDMAFAADWCNPFQRDCTWPHCRSETWCRCEPFRIETIREEIWENLPSYFGLPEWSVLRAELEDASKET